MASKQHKQSSLTRMPHDQLFFDAKNPRLVEFVGKQTPSQGELLDLLWTEMAVDEVAMSIAADGFWDQVHDAEEERPSWTHR